MLLEDLGDEPADALPVEDRIGALIADSRTAHHERAQALMRCSRAVVSNRRPAVCSDQIAVLSADRTVPLPADSAHGSSSRFLVSRSCAPR